MIMPARLRGVDTGSPVVAHINFESHTCTVIEFDDGRLLHVEITTTGEFFALYHDRSDGGYSAAVRHPPIPFPGGDSGIDSKRFVVEGNVCNAQPYLTAALGAARLGDHSTLTFALLRAQAEIDSA